MIKITLGKMRHVYITYITILKIPGDLYINITEILLKVALHTITINPNP